MLFAEAGHVKRDGRMILLFSWTVKIAAITDDPLAFIAQNAEDLSLFGNGASEPRSTLRGLSCFQCIIEALCLIRSARDAHLEARGLYFSTSSTVAYCSENDRRIRGRPRTRVWPLNFSRWAERHHVIRWSRWSRWDGKSLELFKSSPHEQVEVFL